MKIKAQYTTEQWSTKNWNLPGILFWEKGKDEAWCVNQTTEFIYQEEILFFA